MSLKQLIEHKTQPEEALWVVAHELLKVPRLLADACWAPLCYDHNLSVSHSVADACWALLIVQHLCAMTITYPSHPGWQALAELHALGVVHMDVKPANVLLDRRYGLALCDYGISVQLPHETPTQDGDGLYLAPEVLTKAYPVT